MAILGAGAAGLFCAGQLRNTDHRVIIVEHNNSPGKKIRISGGGRCNFTNIHTTHRQFLSSNPDFARSALTRYTPQHFIALVDRYGIKWHEKTLGQLFCDGSAQQIIDMLLKEIGALNRSDSRDAHDTDVVHLHTTISSVTKSDHFVVDTSHGLIHARNVVVATGGLSIPKLGASDLGYRIAKKFGLPVVTPEPALVPLTFDNEWIHHWSVLTGVSLDVEASIHDAAFHENMLFTHKGLTGPAILQASSYWHRRESIVLDVLPNVDVNELAETARTDRRILRNVLGDHLPLRFIQQWPDNRLELRADQIKKDMVIDLLHGMKKWVVKPVGTEGFLKAEVTRGGVDTRALSSRTMEANGVPGLFFIGEVVDVTGWLGGYNFQWAWSSAHACAQELSQRY